MTCAKTHIGESPVRPSASLEPRETPVFGASLFPVGEGRSKTGLTRRIRPGESRGAAWV